MKFDAFVISLLLYRFHFINGWGKYPMHICPSTNAQNASKWYNTIKFCRYGSSENPWILDFIMEGENDAQSAVVFPDCRGV